MINFKLVDKNNNNHGIVEWKKTKYIKNEQKCNLGFHCNDENISYHINIVSSIKSSLNVYSSMCILEEQFANI